MSSSAFSYRDFRLLITGRFLFSLAVQLQAVVMGWQMYELMHDPLYLGLIGLVEAIPALGLALFSGYLVDRGNPLKIYRGVLFTSLISISILFFTSTSLGFELSIRQRAQILYFSAFITGLARGFSGPSLYSVIPKTVPREAYNASAAWVTSAIQLATVTGPALGGFAYVWGKAPLAYGLGCILLCGGSLALSIIKTKTPSQPVAKGAPIFEELMVGIRFVFSHSLLLPALALDMFAVLFGGVVAILPIYAGEILRVGPTGLGILRSSPSIGAIIASVFLIRKPITRGAGNILLACVGGFGLCIIGFGVSPHFWVSVVFLALSGALDSISMVIRGAIVQLCAPEGMRGRVAAVNSIFIGSSNELGAFESGIAAKFMGTVASVVFGGSISLACATVAGFTSRSLRRLDLSKL